MASPARRFSFRALLTRLASLRVSVICLLLLLMLTAWGTVYQAGHGLYAAQLRFFYSWVFLNWGFIPFPGAQLVLWILFCNLAASMVVRTRYDFKNIGNIVTHGGLLFLLAGTFVTHRYAVESYLPLAEGGFSNVSLDHRRWELAVWAQPSQDEGRKVVAVDVSSRSAGETVDFNEIGIKAKVEAYYANAMAEVGSENSGLTSNPEGISQLMSKKPASDPEDNIPGAKLTIQSPDGGSQDLLLYGAQTDPVPFTVQGKSLFITLRKKRYPLPFSVKLLDVKKEDYPGTNIPKSYESEVLLRGESGVNRRVRIYMNHPLREKDFTFYQASYSIDAEGKESSVFAVVENGGRLIPYISSALIFGGMLVHFVIMLFGYAGRTRRGGSR